MGAFEPSISFEKGSYIETDTGSAFIPDRFPLSPYVLITHIIPDKVSRKAIIVGATNIILGGKSIIQKGAVVRGDLRRSAAGQHVVISMGRYCLVGEETVIRPPGKIYKGAFTFYPVRISDFVHIGPNCIVEAASIGHGVEIGAGSVIVRALIEKLGYQGKFAIIKDLARILPDSVLPDGAVIPSMTVWGGNPARLIQTLPETYQETMETQCKGYYQRFRAV